MLRRNRKKDEPSISAEDARAFHMASPSMSSSHIVRTNSPPIFDPTGQPLKLPNAFSPHAKTSTAGSNSSGSGQQASNAHHQNALVYPQSSAAASQSSSSSTKFAGVSSIGSNSPKMQDRQLASHQSANSSAHVLHPSAAQNQYRRGSGSRDNSSMMPPASRSLKGTRHHQHVYPADGANAFSFSQSVDALGQDNSYAVQNSNETTPQQVQTIHHQPQQSQNVGRSQSALNFLLSKARASFSSSSSASASSSAALAAHAQSSSQLANSASVIPSASLSSVQASGSAPSHDEFNNYASRADGILGRNRVASESSGSLLHAHASRPLPRARPSFGEESAPASSPTKRGFFNRERKASLVSLGKSANAAKQPFSNSPLGRAPLMRYESPGGRSQSTTNFVSQFSKSQTDLHTRSDFPSPPSTTLDLPNLLPPSQSSGAMARNGHSRVPTANLSTSGDSAFLRSPSPNVGFSKSVDDLNRASPPPTASPDFLVNPKFDRENLWNEHGLAPTERGRASDTGALGLGRTRGSSMTMDSSSGAVHAIGQQESQTYDSSSRHQRKSSRPKINVRPAEGTNVAPGLISPREIGKPALGPGVTYDGLLYRNMNVSMSINQLNGKEKEKDIGKGWKPFRVIMKEGKMYFYKPSGSAADDIKLLFPTSITPAELASRRDPSPSRFPPNSPGLSASSSAPGLTMEDLKRSKLSTRDLLAATSSTSSHEQDVRSDLRSRTQKDSRLSAIMDTSETENLHLSSMQPASLPNWARPNAHADLLLSSFQSEPESWVGRIRGGPAIALAHEYVYATQSDGLTSRADNAAMLHFVVEQMQEAAMPLQVFLSAVRKWATIAISTRANTAMNEELEREIVGRLEAIRDADLPSRATDDATRNVLQRTIAEVMEQFHLNRSAAPEGSRSAFIPVRSDHVKVQGSLNVPSEGQRQLSTSAPSQLSTSPVLAPSAPTSSEKETRRMTAFFRGAVRPIGLMSSSSSTLGNEQLPPRSYNELLASVSLQKPASAVACGSGRVSVWHNAQRSYVFNLTPADGGHILLQAHNAQEMQEWCNAIEQASKAFAKSVVAASTEMTRKGSGGLHGVASTPATPKTVKAPLVPLYGTDVKILAEHEGNAIPLGLSRMLEEVEKRGLREQGLYRISGAKSAIEALKYALTTQPASNVNLTTGEWSDVHTIAGAIKQWFRDLPEPAIPFSSYHALIAAERIESEEDRLYAFRDILWEFPRAHFDLLKRISAHLAMVCAEGTYNLMAPHNIGLVFGTSLLNPPPGPASVAESFGNIGKAAHIVKIIVTTHEWLFEPEPEEEEGEDDDDEKKAAAAAATTTETTNVSDEDHRSASASDEATGAESAQVEPVHDDSTSNDANATEIVEGQSDSAIHDLGESTLTVSTFGADTSGNTTAGYDVEPITPADGSEVGLSRSHDDSTPRQSLVESESPAPWLENPLLTVDEGTIDSHASESSMMRAVLGAHHVSPIKAVGEHALLHAFQPTSSSLEYDRVTAHEENERATTSKMLSAKSSQADLRPSLSRANSSQQVFLDVDEEMSSTGGSGEHLHTPLLPQQQHRSILTSTEPHDRTVESVYLDATDAMAILQSNYDEERHDNSIHGGVALKSDIDSDRHSEQEVEEVLEHSTENA